MTRVWLLLLVLVAGAPAAFAQENRPFEAGAQLTIGRIGELDATDVGVSGRLSWFPAASLGVEAEVGFSPGDVPEGTAISSNRVEGLFGVTAGPRLGPWRPFARLRPGFLRIGEAPEPVACILIFPPPLSCTLAGGRTLFALDVGGGVSVDVTPGTSLRIDIGDRMTRYPGPAFGRGRRVHDRGFYGHDLRVAIGAAWRF
ncbi:MAG: hypothetical protein AB7P99_05590 [Vicinamibacterales bacterium]